MTRECEAFTLAAFVGVVAALLGFAVGSCSGTIDGQRSACRAHCEALDHDAGEYRERRCVCSDEVSP